MKKTSAAFLVVLLALGSSSAWADLYRVSIDLSGLSGGVELQAALYNNSGVVGDSWVLMDNVVLGSAIDDFESGLGGFNISLNPNNVGVVAGSLNGDGASVLRIDEDPGETAFMETYAYRDYLSPAGSPLVFDLGLTLSNTEGSRSKDELVISILDPDLNPLFEGLTGRGDVLAISPGSVHFTPGVVTLTPVPLPAAVLLGLLGFGTAALGLKRQH